MLAVILYFYNRLLDSFLPVVVCSGEVAAVGVSVKKEMTIYQVYIYNIQQKYRFQGIDEGEISIVLQKCLSPKFKYRTVGWLIFYISLTDC